MLRQHEAWALVVLGSPRQRTAYDLREFGRERLIQAASAGTAPNQLWLIAWAALVIALVSGGFELPTAVRVALTVIAVGVAMAGYVAARLWVGKIVAAFRFRGRSDTPATVLAYLLMLAPPAVLATVLASLS